MITLTRNLLICTLLATVGYGMNPVMADSKWDRFDSGAGSEQTPPPPEAPPTKRGQGTVVTPDNKSTWKDYDTPSRPANKSNWDNYDRGRDGDKDTTKRREWDAPRYDNNRDYNGRNDSNDSNMRRYYPHYEEDNTRGSSSDNRITCNSYKNGYVYCKTDVRGRVQIYKQISNAECRYNDSWGYDNGGIWVTNGCRAEFSVENNRRNNRDDIPSGKTIVCNSENHNYTYCEVNTRRGIKLYRQLSDSACELGDTWGYDKRGVWVDAGCRAEFVVY